MTQQDRILSEIENRQTPLKLFSPERENGNEQDSRQQKQKESTAASAGQQPGRGPVMLKALEDRLNQITHSIKENFVQKFEYDKTLKQIRADLTQAVEAAAREASLVTSPSLLERNNQMHSIARDNSVSLPRCW